MNFPKFICMVCGGEHCIEHAYTTITTEGCEAKDNCLNFPEECWYCKYQEGSHSVDNNYKPENKWFIHPAKLREKEAEKLARQFLKQEKAAKNKQQSLLVKNAAKVEDKVIKTLNSGRINKDGDAKLGDLAIDIKHQSTRKNPQINHDEFLKIQTDAKRGGKRHGVLVIVNKDNETFYVMSEELFKETFIK